MKKLRDLNSTFYIIHNIHFTCDWCLYLEGTAFPIKFTPLVFRVLTCDPTRVHMKFQMQTALPFYVKRWISGTAKLSSRHCISSIVCLTKMRLRREWLAERNLQERHRESELLSM